MSFRGRRPVVPLIESRFPGTTRDGAVDREALSAAVLSDRDELAALEAIVHPAVHHERTRSSARMATPPAAVRAYLAVRNGGPPMRAFDKVMLSPRSRNCQRGAGPVSAGMSARSRAELRHASCPTRKSGSAPTSSSTHPAA